MATLLQPRFFSSPSPFPRSRLAPIRANLHGSADRPSYLSLPTHLPLLPANDLHLTAKGGEKQLGEDKGGALPKLYAILEAAADRAEMHAIVAAQRNNWNTLLLGSVNSATLAAALMAGLSAGGAAGSILAFKLSSSLLYAAATGMMAVVNRIQPSQLVEEQRNAARLFRQLEQSIRTTISLRQPTPADVDRAMDRVLALDRAYPLPLTGGAMLDKFPETVEPTVWWPPKLPHNHHHHHHQRRQGARVDGWSEELEKEMEGVLVALRRKDIAEYVKLGRLALQVNRALAVAGPLLSGLAAVATAAIDPSRGSWPVVAGVACGVAAAVVNTMEHGGQVGMVFELFRNVAGYYEQLDEMIESNLEEDGEGREDGELFEMKVALQLGRTTSELRELASSSTSSPSSSGETGFAGKLF